EPVTPLADEDKALTIRVRAAPVLAESGANRMLRNGRSLRSYNDLAGRNGSGHCGDATMPRDSPVGSSRR
ncbi:MAG: hypothetical protein ABSC15_21125, partial [Terriglobales bacterium]